MVAVGVRYYGVVLRQEGEDEGRRAGGEVVEEVGGQGLEERDEERGYNCREERRDYQEGLKDVSITHTPQYLP